MQHLFTSQMEKLLHSVDLNNCKAEVKGIQHELVGVGSEVIVQESSSNEIIHQQYATIFMSLVTRPGLLTTLPRGVLVEAKLFLKKTKKQNQNNNNKNAVALIHTVAYGLCSC